MAEKRNIEACFSPQLYPVYRDDERIVVIIDILRATSAICTALDFGAKAIIPVATLELAMEYKSKGYLVGAERDAEKLDGYDFGNSPFHYMVEHIRDKEIALTTTNGTQAIEAAKDAYMVVIGSFLNIDALCNMLLSEHRNILLLCSGWKNKFNLEDALFAGAVTEKLSSLSGDFTYGDGCLALRYLYQIAEKDPYKFLNYSSHKERLARLNLKEDIRYCLKPNQTAVIPVLKNGKLVAMETEEEKFNV
jgi:2-phosphosulfolactate phosphatase